MSLPVRPASLMACFTGPAVASTRCAVSSLNFARCEKADLVGGSPAENAAITRAILSGEETGHKRNAVLLNAGAALYLDGKAETMAEGVKLAAQLIDSGAAVKTLEKLIEVSNRPEANA